MVGKQKDVCPPYLAEHHFVGVSHVGWATVFLLPTKTLKQDFIQKYYIRYDEMNGGQTKRRLPTLPGYLAFSFLVINNTVLAM